MNSLHKNNAPRAIATFNGGDGIIQLLNESIDVQELYSRWVDWATQGDNLKYLPAIDASLLPKVMGGCSATIKYRWRIKPVNKPHTLKVFGSITLDDGSSPFIDTDGGHKVDIEYSGYINESATEKLKKQAKIEAGNDRTNKARKTRKEKSPSLEFANDQLDKAIESRAKKLIGEYPRFSATQIAGKIQPELPGDVSVAENDFRVKIRLGNDGRVSIRRIQDIVSQVIKSCK